LVRKIQIILIFNDNDKVLFYNDKTGLIDKSLLVQDNQLYKNLTDNSKKEITEIHPMDGYSFKTDLEILIRLFYYYRFLKEKDNLDFKPLKVENNRSVYLINNDWIEKYKSFFEYKDLENYLLQLKDDRSNLIDNDFISEDYIRKLITNLPGEYINKLQSKMKSNNKFDKKEKFKNYEYDKVIETKDGKQKEISYLINNQLINTKIHGLLIKGGYEISDEVKNGDLYFIGNKKILLLFKREIASDNNYDEIGYINGKNVFIPEYVLDYTNNDIKLSYFKIFFNSNFINFCSQSDKESCHIYDENN
jgi:hypothetical protein